MSFDRPVEPFEGHVITVLDDDMVKVYDESSAELLGSHRIDAEAWQVRASHQRGAVYVTSESPDDLLQVSRIDAGGIETLKFDRRGFVDHAVDAPVPSLVIRTEEDAELVRFQSDGQIDRHIFDEAIFIEVTADALMLRESNTGGDMWVMDQDLNVISVVDLDAEEATAPDVWLPNEFGDGWRVEAGDGVVEFFNPDGQAVNEVSTEPLRNVSTFEHPTENIVLVVLRTCESREGNTCLSTESGNDGDADTEDSGDVPYVPPNFIRVLQFDTDDASISEVGDRQSTSLAAMAVESGWTIATVDGSSTVVSSIGRNGEVASLAEVPSRDEFTLEYVIPVGSQSLGLSDWDASQVAVFTDEGMQLVDGLPLTNPSAWQLYQDRFAHVG